MTLRSRRFAGPVRVALCFANRSLHERIAAACTEIGIAVSASDGAIGGAGIVLTDHAAETGTPTILIGTSREDSARDDLRDGWNGIGPADIRAIVPDDIETETLGAVIEVVVAGLMVLPRAYAKFADTPERETGDAEEPARGAIAMEYPVAEEFQAALSAREHEVLALLCEGASNKAIARALGLSVHTVKFHLASLTEKLGAKNRFEAIAIAVRNGLVMV